MKKILWSLAAGLAMVAFSGLLAASGSEQKAQSAPGNFFEKSLHYTNQGLSYWYAKEQGGLERITGIPFSELDCTRCHIRSCDTCHRKEVDGKPAYSLEPARAQQVCQDCHNMPSLTFARENKDHAKADVHFRRGMKCMDCHSAREIHGDGTAYTSIQAPGAMDTRCENCHAATAKCPGRTVHGDKVHCNACHIRDLPSCYNCHFDSRVKEGKSLSLPLNNLLFLVNHDGQVTLGNLHTFVYQNRTMITFAPSFPHSIMREGRLCRECHDTPILKDIKANTFSPVIFENGGIRNVAGIVPVIEGLNWNFTFLNYQDGRWIPIENPAEPLLNYAGYCSPITKEQFARLSKPQAGK